MSDNNLLEAHNNWQIMRAQILDSNNDRSMNMVIRECDQLIINAIYSARSIAHRVQWDFYEAKRLAKEVSSKEDEQ